MAKIIDFIIIVFLIGLIIYLFATMFKAPKSEAPIKPRSTKDECEILIKTLKMKLKEAHEDAIAGKADAQGKASLVKIEYEQKQKQLVSIVAAQTAVELAQQDLEKQAIQEKAAIKEASKIKILADANAYEKQRDIQANGALEQKLDAYVKVMTAAYKAVGDYQGNWVPTYMSGNGAYKNGASEMMDILGAKAARDLSLDLKTK